MSKFTKIKDIKFPVMKKEEEKCIKEFSQLTPQLFLASASAITDDDLKKNDINLIINATEELEMYLSSWIHTIRVPVTDDNQASLYPYFKVLIFYFFDDRSLPRHKQVVFFYLTVTFSHKEITFIQMKKINKYRSSLVSKSLKRALLLGNLPLRHQYAKPLFMS